MKKFFQIGIVAARVTDNLIMISDERVPREDTLENSDKVFQITQDRKGISSVKAI